MKSSVKLPHSISNEMKERIAETTKIVITDDYIIDMCIKAGITDVFKTISDLGYSFDELKTDSVKLRECFKHAYES